MNSARLVFAICFSIVFTGSILAVIFYVIARNSSSTNVLGPNSDWAWLGLILGAIYGLVVGGTSAGVIAGFELSIPKAILFGLIFNFLVGAALASSWGNTFGRKLDR